MTDTDSPPLGGLDARRWRSSSAFGEQGWQYGGSFAPWHWANEQGALAVVRRRVWYRTLHGPHPTHEEIGRRGGGVKKMEEIQHGCFGF